MAVSTSPARVDGLPALPGVEHHWWDVPSGCGRVLLHVAEAGAGTPVLLLHGWPQHWWCWRRVIGRLRNHYRLLAPDPWARPSPSTVAGLRRAWFAGLVATPILGERVVRHPRCVPWFLRLGGQAALFSDEDAALYAEQFRDPARVAAASRLYRYYLQTARVVLLRRAYAGQRLSAPTRLLFGADDFYIPLALLQDIEAHGDDLTLEVVRGCSHWMPEERPDLIAERALALFG